MQVDLKIWKTEIYPYSHNLQTLMVRLSVNSCRTRCTFCFKVNITVHSCVAFGLFWWTAEKGCWLMALCTLALFMASLPVASKIQAVFWGLSDIWFLKNRHQIDCLIFACSSSPNTFWQFKQVMDTENIAFFYLTFQVWTILPVVYCPDATKTEMVSLIFLIDDRLYSAILCSLQQTHCAHMWFYMSD